MTPLPTRKPAGTKPWHTGIVTTAAVIDTPPAVASPVPAAGQTCFEFDLPVAFNYKLGKELGRGVYGVVYHAEAPGGVRVAVKKVSWGVGCPAGASEREALDAVKRLSHPFLLQTHAYWVAGAELCIVMELAEGTLQARLAECQFDRLPGVPAAELVAFFEEAAEALDYLHSKNITHRDVKPQNLLYLKGHAKVADLGLARLQLRQLEDVGRPCGTPLYMAPEVWTGHVDFRSDQYSLAASYVTARLGRPVFPVATQTELMAAHLYDAPALPELAAAERAVVLRALAKEPADRFPSCGAFAAALWAAVRPAPVPVPPRPPRRAAMFAFAAVILAAAGFAVFRPVEAAPIVAPPPPGWAAAPDSAVIEDAGRRFHARIVRTLPDNKGEVAAVRVRVVRGDITSFYIGENKITNWQAGRPGDPDAPALGVTAGEAALAAAALGGQLPTTDEWKAACEPGRPSCYPPGTVTAPRPVADPGADVSAFGVRQMRTNGEEWTRTDGGWQNIDPAALTLAWAGKLRTVGRGWGAGPGEAGPEPNGLLDHTSRLDIGFRVVVR